MDGGRNIQTSMEREPKVPATSNPSLLPHPTCDAGRSSAWHATEQPQDNTMQVIPTQNNQTCRMRSKTDQINSSPMLLQMRSLAIWLPNTGRGEASQRVHKG